LSTFKGSLIHLSTTFFSSYPFIFHAIPPPILLRSISLTSGLLSILFIYFFSQKLFNKKILACLAAFLIATSPLHIEQSQLIRVYPLALLFLILLYSFFLGSDYNPTRLFWMSCLYLLLIFTHFSGLIYFPLLILCFCLALRRNVGCKLLFNLLLTFSASLLIVLFSNQAPEGLRLGHISGLFGQSSNLKDLVIRFSNLFKGFLGDQRGTPFLGFFLFFIGSFSLVQRKRFFIFTVLWAPFIFSIFLHCLGFYPITNGRHSLHLYPAFLLLVLFGCDYVLNRSRFLFLFFLIILVFFQFRSSQSIYHPDRNRWRFGEGSPKFSFFSEASRIIRSGDLSAYPLALDGGLFNSVKMESEIRPAWGLFYTSDQKFSYCSWGATDNETEICKCLKNSHAQFPNTDIFFLFLHHQNRNKGLNYSFRDNHCFITLDEIKINESQSFLKVKLISHTGETGRID